LSLTKAEFYNVTKLIKTLQLLKPNNHYSSQQLISICAYRDIFIKTYSKLTRYKDQKGTKEWSYWQNYTVHFNNPTGL